MKFEVIIPYLPFILATGLALFGLYVILFTEPEDNKRKRTKSSRQR